LGHRLLFGRSDTGRIAYGGLYAGTGISELEWISKDPNANDPDLYERDRLARIKLLAKFGVSLEHEWEEIIEAFKRMEAGFPEQYKACCH